MVSDSYRSHHKHQKHHYIPLLLFKFHFPPSSPPYTAFIFIAITVMVIVASSSSSSSSSFQYRPMNPLHILLSDHSYHSTARSASSFQLMACFRLVECLRPVADASLGIAHRDWGAAILGLSASHTIHEYTAAPI